MAELVTRTFISTKITFNVIETDNASVWLGEPQTIVVTGKVDEEAALKAVKKSQGKNRMYIINNLEYLEEMYACSVTDFISISKKVEK